LDIFLVRELGVPGHQEVAMGALVSGGACVLNDDVVSYLNISREAIDEVAAKEQEKLKLQERSYRVSRPAAQVAGRTVILVTDGLVVNSTIRAAVIALRAQQAARIIVAIPSASTLTCLELKAQVDEIACAPLPKPFYALAPWYKDFTQITDEEVRTLLARARQPALRAA
jgi:predicted phosphoribosyltransferase